MKIYVRSSQFNKASDIQARDFMGIDMSKLSEGEIIEVRGLDWLLYHIDSYPRAIEYKFFNDDTDRTITVKKFPGHPEWLRMSSVDSSLNVDMAVDAIRNSNKPCVYTYGLAYRHPTTYRVPISKEEAIKIIKGRDAVDVEEEADVFHINKLSGSDLV
jgi:hypothetical protein